jgi:hypothetical protein
MSADSPTEVIRADAYPQSILLFGTLEESNAENVEELPRISL